MSRRRLRSCPGVAVNKAACRKGGRVHAASWQEMRNSAWRGKLHRDKVLKAPKLDPEKEKEAVEKFIREKGVTRVEAGPPHYFPWKADW